MGLIIINNNDLHISDKGGMNNFSELYVGWINQTYSNLFSVTGYFVKLDWIPD